MEVIGPESKFQDQAPTQQYNAHLGAQAHLLTAGHAQTKPVPMPRCLDRLHSLCPVLHHFYPAPFGQVLERFRVTSSSHLNTQKRGCAHNTGQQLALQLDREKSLRSTGQSYIFRSLHEQLFTGSAQAVAQYLCLLDGLGQTEQTSNPIITQRPGSMVAKRSFEMYVACVTSVLHRYQADFRPCTWCGSCQVETPNRA